MLAGPLLACGPDFPETYYDRDGRQLLAAPEGYFAVEIDRVARDILPTHRAVVTLDQKFAAANWAADAIELPRALAERGVPARTAQEITDAYGESRRQLEATKGAGADWCKLPELAKSLPIGLPMEFAAYFRGAEHWARGQVAEARENWQRVLQLPAAERHYRSTWSAFMLGRTWLAEAELGSGPEAKQACDDAVENFRRVRTLVSEGCADPLGLAVASLGWEARAELARGAYAPAIRLYLEQQAAGDPTALESLRRTATRLITMSTTELTRLAGDAGVRRVFTAYLIARGGPRYDEMTDGQWPEKLAQRWALALKEAGVQTLPEADRLAWVAYEGGLFALARDWAALAPADSPEAEWIRAKLALRDGNLAEGEKFMRSALATTALIEPHRVRLEAELGRVCLAQNDFAGALSAWMDGGQWEDAAFVAEHVMTSRELACYVDRSAKVAPTTPSAEMDPRARFIRHLLARRLARTGKAQEAAQYFPPEDRARFVTYTADVQGGFDASRPAAERAKAFWRAAKTVREYGMEFLGTELDPDWAIWGGNYALDPTVQARLGIPVSVGGIFAPTALETARLQDQGTASVRFHYRYRAAELAWWAASLLPNESEETAMILNEAGGWLKYRDPSAARPFYQALVIRCGHTELGEAATAKRWFPD
ncbi:MAG: hypothetical protein ABI222_01715 [Opitutaceae bacterium]